MDIEKSEQHKLRTEKGDGIMTITFNSNIDTILDRLDDMLEESANTRIGQIVHEGFEIARAVNPYIGLTVDDPENGVWQIASEPGDDGCGHDHAAFIEFGTGQLVDSGNQFVRDMSYDVAPGSYSMSEKGAGTWANPMYWKNGRYRFNTYPQPGMSDAYSYMRAEIEMLGNGR